MPAKSNQEDSAIDAHFGFVGMGTYRYSDSTAYRLVGIRIGRRGFVVQKILRGERGGYGLKLEGRLAEVEAVGKIVGAGISVTERREGECLLD